VPAPVPVVPEPPLVAPAPALDVPVPPVPVVLVGDEALPPELDPMPACPAPADDDEAAEEEDAEEEDAEEEDAEEAPVDVEVGAPPIPLPPIPLPLLPLAETVGQPAARSSRRVVRASASVDSSFARVCSAELSDDCALSRLAALESFVAVVPPASAWVSVDSALASEARAWARVSAADTASMLARCSPACTCSPTCTLSAERVPLIGKLRLAVVAAATLPVEVSSSCTVPVATLVVRAGPVAAVGVMKTELKPKPSSVPKAAKRRP
jgi:hypothetical protein